MGLLQKKSYNLTRTFAGFWTSLNTFSSRFGKYGFDHWYLFTIAPYLILLILDIFHQIIKYRSIDLSRTLIETSDLPHWIVLSSVIALSFIALAFNRVQRLIPETLQELFEKRRILVKDRDRDLNQEYDHFLTNYRRSLENNIQLLLIGALMILTVVLTLSPTLQRIILYARSDLIHFVGTTMANVLIPLLWTYFAAVGAWVLIITGVFLRKLTDIFTLKILPSHPDKCGGLRILGNLCLAMALPILIGTLFLGIFGIGGVIDPTAPITIAANIGLLVFALPLVYFVFLAPMWNIHSRMIELKKKFEDEFADNVTNLEEKMRTFLSREELDNAKSAKDKWEIHQLFNPDKINYPSWPFDRRIFLRFLTPQIVPVISLIVGLSDPMAEAIRSLITMFTGN